MMKELPYILIALALIILLIVFADVSTNKLIIKEYTIENKKVSKGVDQYKGIKIVFFSDLHIGKLLKKEELKEKLSVLKSFNADLYIFGGDLIGIDTVKYYSIEDVKECFEILNDCNKIAVYGNHEYKKIKHGDSLKLDYFNAMGFKVLINEEYNFQNKLCIFGKQECIYHEDVIINKEYDLIISHQGDIIDKYDNQIILSGHTHGGQIRIPLIPIYYRPKKGKKYTSGLIQKNNSKLVISSGLGYGGFKVRLFSPMDIVLIDYRK